MHKALYELINTIIAVSMITFGAIFFSLGFGGILVSVVEGFSWEATLMLISGPLMIALGLHIHSPDSEEGKG